MRTRASAAPRRRPGDFCDSAAAGWWRGTARGRLSRSGHRSEEYLQPRSGGSGWDPRSAQATPQTRRYERFATSSPARIGPPRRNDARRPVAAFLSSIYPGLGQLLNGHVRLALTFAVPVALLAGALVFFLADRPAGVIAALVRPDTLMAVIVLDIVFLLWRLVSIGQAFAAAWRGPVGKVAVIGLVLILTWAIVPQVAAGVYVWGFRESTSEIFVGATVTRPGEAPVVRRPLFPGDDPGTTAGPTPQGLKDRINILLLGVDAAPRRTHALTDTMIVASVDPVGKTVSMISIPRDLVDVPLPNGEVYPRKLNTLLSSVNDGRVDEEDFAFANGSGTRALQDAIGTLLDIPIHYYAKVNLRGFVRVVDAVGGVDVRVRKRLHAPDHRDYGVDGLTLEPGVHHLDGPHALAYARVRKATGENDFTRAGRQQEILVGIKNAALDGGALALLGRLDRLLQAMRGAVRTDVPPEHFSDLAFIAESIESDRVTRAVIMPPLVTPDEDDRGYVLLPDLDAIRDVAARLFPPPGGRPQPWPTPTPGTTEPGG